jgi:alpha-tubulin suppressor-like RCC1 family protein
LAGRTFTDVAAGISNVFVLQDNGNVYGWGEGGNNLLTTVGSESVPVPVNARTGVTKIAAGGQFAIAIKTDGSLVAWGNNDKGQTDAPAGTGFTAIDGGDFHGLAVKSDGTVLGWGDNTFGQANAPAGLTGVVAVSAGKNHSLALLSNGRVVGWGNNAFGQISIPTDATNVVAIAAGRDCSLAVTADGKVLRWGQTTFANFASLPTSGAIAVAAENQNAIISLGNMGVLVGGTILNNVNVSRTPTRTPTP